MKKLFHHVGIPTTEVRQGERYSPTYKMYTSGGEYPTRIQYHRFEPDCPLHPLIQNKPHVAFKVSNLEQAIEGKKIILEAYTPFKGFRVAMTEENGMPVEYIETSLTEQQIWDDDQHEDSLLYPSTASI